MRVADLERLYRYSSWANRQLFRVLAELTDEEFTRPVAGGHASARNTLVHILSAEWGWLERCGGPPRGDRLRTEDYATVEALITTWTSVEEHMRGFLAGLTDAGLARKISYAFGGGPEGAATIGDLLCHVILHAVHHRGQVALLLRALGHAPGAFDFLVYAGAGSEPPGSSPEASRAPSPSPTSQPLPARRAPRSGSGRRPGSRK